MAASTAAGCTCTGLSDSAGCNPTDPAPAAAEEPPYWPSASAPARKSAPPQLNEPSALTLLAGAAACCLVGSRGAAQHPTGLPQPRRSASPLTCHCFAARRLSPEAGGHLQLVCMQQAPLAASHLTPIDGCSDRLLLTPTAATGSDNSCTTSMSCKQLRTALISSSRHSVCSCIADSNLSSPFNPALL